MMTAKIITLGHSKGGVGKSTLAYNLSIAAMNSGFRVVLVDADKQQSCSKFKILRADRDTHPLRILPITGKTLGQDLVALSKDEDLDLVIVDVAGHDSVELRQTLVVSDRFLVPTPPSPPDLLELPPLLELAVQAGRSIGRLPSMNIVLARCNPNVFINDWAKALDLIEGYPKIKRAMPPLPVILYERQAYRDALETGLGVVELIPSTRQGDRKAAEEVRELLTLATAGANNEPQPRP